MNKARSRAKYVKSFVTLSTQVSVLYIKPSSQAEGQKKFKSKNLDTWKANSIPVTN